jgi:ketosteroid isomerase-like protein
MDIQSLMSSYRKDVAALLVAQIETALKQEYDRGWAACMEYYWAKREKDGNDIPQEETSS